MTISIDADNIDRLILYVTCFISIYSIFKSKKNSKSPDAVEIGSYRILSLINPLNWWPFLLNLTPGSTLGSKLRRLLAYGALACSAFLTLEATIPNNYTFGPEAYIFLAFALGFFISSTFGVLSLSEEHFIVNPMRMVKDTFISCAFITLACAVFYRNGGITASTCLPPADVSKWNSIYFSAVTFSTLGYGDLKPCGYAKIIAVMQAVLGNVHLAFLVSASFLAISNTSKSTKKSGEE